MSVALHICQTPGESGSRPRKINHLPTDSQRGLFKLGQAVGNIVGGGNGAAIFGGGDDMTIQYSLPGAGGGGAGWGTAGLVGRFVNTQGDGLQVEYGAPTEPARAGREAWLTGGGDDAQVVYAAPYQRR